MCQSERLAVMMLLDKKAITQKEAGMRLHLCDRQIRRLYRRYQAQGPTGLNPLYHLPNPRNAKHDATTKQRCLELIRSHYYDYGPTLAAEKLNEYDGLTVSKETIRHWMSQAGLWHPKTKKESPPRPPRARRPCFGELIQIDGSYHAWFGDEHPKSCLLVFVDDATSGIVYLQFVRTETTVDYLAALRHYLLSYGKPRAFYSDKHNVFRVNHPEAKSGDGMTQFGRTLDTLAIEMIYAHSPQAKGRVERANLTLQDRLIKWLRYRGITTPEQANQGPLDEFRQEYNRKFAKLPYDSNNLHQPLNQTEHAALPWLCAEQQVRTVSKDNTISLNKVLYHIKVPDTVRTLHRAKVLVCKDESDRITLYHNHQVLEYQVYNENYPQFPILSRKEIDAMMDAYLRHKPNNPR